MKLFKKLVCVSLAMSMTLGLTACGGNGGNDKSNAGNTESKVEVAKSNLADSTFRKDDSFSILGLRGKILSFVASSEYIFIATNEAEESTASDADAEFDGIQAGSSVNRIYRVPADGGDAEVVHESGKDDYEYIEKMTVAYDGSIYAIINNEDGSGIYKYDAEGETKIGDVTNYLESDGMTVSNFTVDKDGNIVLVYDTSVKVLDSSLNEKCTCKSEDAIQNVGLDKDGNAIVSTIKFTEDFEVDNISIRKVDVSAGSLSEAHKLDTATISAGNLMKGEGGYDFFYSTQTSVYGFKYDGEASEKVADYGVSGVNGSLVHTCWMLSDTSFVISELDAATYEILPELKKFNKVDPSEIKDKHIFTLATIYGGSDIAQAAIDYNNSQSENVVEIISYSDAADPVGKFSADLASGVKPDFYDVSNSGDGLTLRQYISKGMLEDLTPYLEKDNDISSSDIVPTMYDAMLEDGKLYFVSPAALIMSVTGKKSEIGAEPGWTYGEMKEYVLSKPEGTRLFRSSNKMDALQSFKGVCCADFVDWKAGECHFDSQDFKDILEMCNTGVNEEMDWDDDSVSDMDLLNGVQLFVQGAVTADELAWNNQLLKGDATVKGFPSNDKSGGRFSFMNAIAMSSECSDKEAGWDFLKYFLSEDFQGKYYQNQMGIPTRNDVFDVYLDGFTYTKDGKDKYGNEVKARDSKFEMEGISIDIKPLTEDEIEQFKVALESTKGRWEPDNKIWAIVTEEAAAYFSGDKSIDDVCNVIQDRVTTYVNESK